MELLSTELETAKRLWALKEKRGHRIISPPGYRAEINYDAVYAFYERKVHDAEGMLRNGLRLEGAGVSAQKIGFYVVRSGPTEKKFQRAVDAAKLYVEKTIALSEWPRMYSWVRSDGEEDDPVVSDYPVMDTLSGFSRALAGINIHKADVRLSRASMRRIRQEMVDIGESKGVNVATMLSGPDTRRLPMMVQVGGLKVYLNEMLYLDADKLLDATPGTASF